MVVVAPAGLTPAAVIPKLDRPSAATLDYYQIGKQPTASGRSRWRGYLAFYWHLLCSAFQ
jgi:hypothetical protein